MHVAPPDPAPEPSTDSAGAGSAPSSDYERVLAATEHAVDRSRALLVRLRRVDDAYPTAEERAVELVESALHEMGAAAVVAWRMRDDDTTLELVGTTPLAADLVTECDEIALGADCLVSEAARTERVVYAGTRAAVLARYPGLRRAVDALDIETLAAVPARYMGRVRGVLLVAWTSPRTLAPADQANLRMSASRLARAMARARLYYAERAAHASAQRARPAEVAARREAECARAEAEASRRLAEDASRAKDDFLAVVSHELRTPLQAILGFSDLLATEIAGPLAPRQHEYVRRVQAAGGHLLETIENLLGFARAQAGKEVVVPMPFDAAATIAQVVDIAAPLAARKQIALVHAGMTRDLIAVSDERKVRQIVTNLVGNAIKFTERGEVAVEGAVVDDPAAGRRLRITVRDTGIGIPAEQLAGVFEAFVQVSGAMGHTDVRASGGTGLGLSIVRQLARLLGGEVRATSTLGQGSTFVVDLPQLLSSSTDG